MADFFVNLVFSFFIWGTIFVGWIFIMSILPEVLPHVCWDPMRNRRFDIFSIFCFSCSFELLLIFIDSRLFDYTGIMFGILTPAYILYLLVRLHYYDELYAWEMISICLLSLLTKIFLKGEYYRKHRSGVMMPIMTGSALYALTSFYSRLSVKFFVVALIVLISNMFVYSLEYAFRDFRFHLILAPN